jgi:hypothetical protein
MTRLPILGEGVPSTFWPRIPTISRRLLQSVWVAACAPKIRDDMIGMLIKAAYAVHVNPRSRTCLVLSRKIGFLEEYVAPYVLQL